MRAKLITFSSMHFRKGGGTPFSELKAVAKIMPCAQTGNNEALESITESYNQSSKTDFFQDDQELRFVVNIFRGRGKIAP